MKNALFVLSALATVLAAIPASADSIAHPFDVKVGGYFPYDSSYRSDAGDTFWSVGGDYAFKTAPSKPTDTLGLYADFKQSTGRSYNQLFGVGLLYKSDILRDGKMTAKDPYYAIGGGYYWEQKTVRFFNTNTFNNAHGNEFGAKALIGIGLTENVFVEGSYLYLPNKTRASGFGADIGLRF